MEDEQIRLKHGCHRIEINTAQKVTVSKQTARGTRDVSCNTQHVYTPLVCCLDSDCRQPTVSCFLLLLSAYFPIVHLFLVLTRVHFAASL